MGKALNTKIFIERSIQAHGDKYDYSKVIYNGSKNFVIIGCPKHGVFEQRPSDHMKGCGCNKCGIEFKARKLSKNKEVFVEEANTVHDNKYDYSLVNYKNNKAKVTIICPVHGKFKQIPLDHIKGRGCSKCGDIATGNLVRKDILDFIAKANIIHNSKYIYESCNYNTSHTCVTITCPKHGNFKQTPSSHLRGRGCPKCAKISYTDKRAMPFKEFQKKALQTHNGIYSYDTNFYSKASDKTKITCPYHGKFWQMASLHISGQGCPKCNISMGFSKSKFIKKYKDNLVSLYILKFTGAEETFLKVGFTGTTIKKRFQADSKNYKINTVIEVKSDAGSIWDLEKWLHKNLHEYRITPKVLLKGGNTECFHTDVFQFINELMNNNPFVDVWKYYGDEYMKIIELYKKTLTSEDFNYVFGNTLEELHLN